MGYTRKKVIDKIKLGLQYAVCSTFPILLKHTFSFKKKRTIITAQLITKGLTSGYSVLGVLVPVINIEIFNIILSAGYFPNM